MTITTEKLIQSRKQPFQYLLNNRIGYGNAQSKLSLPLYILMFTEGCESVVISLLLPQLEREWGISIFEKSLLITMIYLGVAVGSFVQSWADVYGRLNFIKWNAILQTIFGLLCCISTQMSYFVFFRFIYGIGIGIILPVSGTYISEITPTDMRSSLIAKSRFFWSVGCIFTFACAWYLLIYHHWRILLFIICLPGVYALWQIYQNGRQTLRYLWVTNHHQQTIQLITYMCHLNNKPPISSQQILSLMSSPFTQQSHLQKQLQTSYKDLFNQKYFSMTIYLMIMWFSACFIYYGLFLLFPVILVRNNATSYNMKYFSLILITVVQMSIFMVVGYVIQHPYFGRRRTLYYMFFTIATAAILLIICGEDNTMALMISFMVMRMAIAICVIATIPYTIQIYTTLIRSKGMGVCAVTGRIGTVCLGFVGLNSLEWFGGNGLYIILTFLSLISAYSMFKMPYCTQGRALDS